MKKKIIFFNLLFCIIVIFLNYNYFDSKTKKNVVYNYVETFIVTNYDIERENLKPLENNYRRGMGLYEVEVKNIVTNSHYFFEVDISDDYSLVYIKDLTEIHNKNQRD